MPQHPTRPCPRSGCEGTATLAVQEDFAGEGAALWQCDRGHQGPFLYSAE